MKYVTLYNGVTMPMLGYGVYQIGKSDLRFFRTPIRKWWSGSTA